MKPTGKSAQAAGGEAVPVKYCDATGKRIYTSESEAKRVMRGLSARLRIYRCPFCHGVHMTKEFR